MKVSEAVEDKKPWVNTKDLVRPRTPPEFVELQQKYLPPLVSPRGQPLREISFIGLGASIVEPNRF